MHNAAEPQPKESQKETKGTKARKFFSEMREFGLLHCKMLHPCAGPDRSVRLSGQTTPGQGTSNFSFRLFAGLGKQAGNSVLCLAIAARFVSLGLLVGWG